MTSRIGTKKIIITGGGTGGHVFPALALAEEFMRQGCQIVYVGSPTGFENKIIPQKNIPFYTIKSGALKNQKFLKIFETLFRLFFAVLKSIRILLKEKPNAVVGVGGYVSAPICCASFLMGKRIYLQEQNVSVGIANRLLGKMARTIYLGFPQAAKYFNPTKVKVFGNPLRSEIYTKQFASVETVENTLLILGGSQGAHSINELFIQIAPQLAKQFPNLKIIHQTGEKDAQRVKEAYAKINSNFEVTPFISNVFDYYAKAGLIVSRSGALTVSEIIQAQRPAIFVPYPRKGQNDQTANAYWLESIGAARVVEQGDAFKERFLKIFLDTYEASVLQRMSMAFAPIKQGNSTQRIVEDCLNQLQNV